MDDGMASRWVIVAFSPLAHRVGGAIRVGDSEFSHLICDGLLRDRKTVLAEPAGSSGPKCKYCDDAFSPVGRRP